MEIVRTKLVPPVDRGNLIERPRLMACLEEIARLQVTALVAPAGYGKTSLMLQWYRHLERANRTCAWLTADGSEQDGADLLAHVAAACSNIRVTADLPRKHDFGGIARSSMESMMLSLVEALDRQSDISFLFIDDVDRLGKESSAALERLMALAPPSVRFVIAARAWPELRLSRSLARGELFEVRATELRFTPDETRQFLDAVTVPPLDDRAPAILEQRTEGWIAGMKLATLALHHGGSMRSLTESFASSHHSMATFFCEEYLALQPPEIVDFLLETSVLDCFCPDLCEAVTGNADSRRLLLEIIEKGCFMQQLETNQSWFRYHGLFAAFLQERLTQRHATVRSQLQLRASAWFWEQGSPVEAIEYALKACEPTQAAELLERGCQDLTYVGKVRLVARFAARIPNELLRRYPGVLLTLAWRLTRGLRFEEAGELIAAAGARLEEMANSAELSPMKIRHARYLQLHSEMALAAARDDVVEVQKRCKCLLEDFSEEQHPYLRGAILGHLLEACVAQYHLTNAERISAAAQGMLRRSADCEAAVAFQKVGIGTALRLAGKTGAARQVLELARVEAMHYRGPHSYATAMCSLALGELAYEANHVDLAESLVQESLSSACQFGFTQQLQAAFLTEARIQGARGQTEDALSTLEKGTAIALDRDLMRLRLALAAERVRLLIQVGRLDEARRCAELNGLSLRGHAPQPIGFVTTSEESKALIWIRLGLAANRLFEAIGMARQWSNFCSARGAIPSVVRWELLLAQLHFLNSAPRLALRALRKALGYGSSSRILRTFIDEGPIIHSLLRTYFSDGVNSADPIGAFAMELVSVIDGIPMRAEPATMDAGVQGRVSSREREILGLVAAGMSNREVAQRMGLTEGTVKWYLQQVYDKIGTRRRKHAVERARRFGLIT